MEPAEANNDRLRYVKACPNAREQISPMHYARLAVVAIPPSDKVGGADASSLKKYDRFSSASSVSCGNGDSALVDSATSGRQALDSSFYPSVRNGV